MKLNITQKKENTLLSRVEVTGTFTFEGAMPKRADMIKDVAQATKAKEDMVVVRKMESTYGGSKGTFLAHIYNDAETLKKIEREYMQKRNAAPAAENTEEAQ